MDGRPLNYNIPWPQLHCMAFTMHSDVLRKCSFASESYLVSGSSASNFGCFFFHTVATICTSKRNLSYLQPTKNKKLLLIRQMSSQARNFLVCTGRIVSSPVVMAWASSSPRIA